jgi:hypothetical protein
MTDVLCLFPLCSWLCSYFNSFCMYVFLVFLHIYMRACKSIVSMYVSFLYCYIGKHPEQVGTRNKSWSTGPKVQCASGALEFDSSSRLIDLPEYPRTVAV